MPDLRSFLPIAGASLTQSNYSEAPRLAVYNSSWYSTQNGGATCCWCVPSGIKWATFEVWGAGGDGGGSCCCQGPYGGAGTGTYARKTLAVSSGTCFCLCVGGSGCCSQSCCGTCGFPSFVRCGTDGTVAVCAGGGAGGCTVCGHMGGQSCTGVCIPMCMRDCTGGGYDMALPGIAGASRESNYCTQIQWQWMAGSTKWGPLTRNSMDPCAVSMTRMGCCYWAVFGMGGSPSMGGSHGQACGGGCCWGYNGSSGLIIVSYGT